MTTKTSLHLPASPCTFIRSIAFTPSGTIFAVLNKGKMLALALIMK
jgi:hypothetical protein